MPAPPRAYVPLCQARPYILDADLLAFRGRGWLARLIQRGGRGEHSHVGMACWWSNDLFVLEAREWKGVRAVTLASQVERFPGQIDVYRANTYRRFGGFDRRGAVTAMRRVAGSEYGYASVMAVALAHLVGLRLFARPNLDDDFDSPRPPFCSELVAWANRTGGHVDVVPRLADEWTEPGDLVRSSFYAGYVCTLVPDDWQQDGEQFERVQVNHYGANQLVGEDA